MKISSSYLIKRVGLGLVALVITVSVIGAIVFMIPVDPMRMTFGQMVDQEVLDEKIREFGLDQSSWTRTRYYLRDISPINVSLYPLKLKEDGEVYFSFLQNRVVIKPPHLRSSFQSGRKVIDILREAWPPTLILAVCSLGLGLIIGVLLGLLSAATLDTWLDKFLLSISVLGYSVPSYVSALFFSLVFGHFFGSITGLNVQGGLRSFADNGEAFIQWKNLILPSIALGIRPIAVIMQMTRSTLIGILKENYIVTARSKGIRTSKVWLRHALPNAANPIVSTTTSWLAALLAGAFFVETIFNFRGIGNATIQSLILFDIPVLMGCILSVGVLLITVNILTDVIYAIFDPRISLE